MQLVSELRSRPDQQGDEFAASAASSRKALNIEEADGSHEQPVLLEWALPTGKLGVILTVMGKACT